MTTADRLLPGPATEVDVGAAVESAERPAPSDRPWVAAVFIASADGAATLSGTSGGLGGPADRAAFHAHRHMADLILAGAGTVRAERYGPPPFTDEVKARRRARGQDEVPRIAAVSASLAFSFQEPFFDPAVRPMIIAPESVASDVRARAAERAELLLTGGEEVDLPGALGVLRGRGVERVACEGGPHLFGSLMNLDLIDELALTLAPILVGGDASRIAVGAVEAARAMRLEQVLEDDGFLILRYLRDRSGGG